MIQKSDNLIAFQELIQNLLKKCNDENATSYFKSGNCGIANRLRAGAMGSDAWRTCVLIGTVGWQCDGVEFAANKHALVPGTRTGSCGSWSGLLP